jgi:hypothetical protein
LYCTLYSKMWKYVCFLFFSFCVSHCFLTGLYSITRDFLSFCQARIDEKSGQKCVSVFDNSCQNFCVWSRKFLPLCTDVKVT